jgi:hypothetical protein
MSMSPGYKRRGYQRGHYHGKAYNLMLQSARHGYKTLWIPK